MNIYSHYTGNGTLYWNYSTGNDIFSSPAVDDEAVYVGSGDSLYCIDAGSGELRYRFTTAGDVKSSPAITYRYVLFGSHDNNLYCLDKSTGEELWRFSTGAAIESSPGIYKSNVYFGSNDGILYCLGLTKDISPPSVDLENHPVNVTIGTPYILTGNARDNRHINGVWLSYNNTTWESVVSMDGFSTWNFSLDTSRFRSGENFIYIRVSDGYFNVTLNHSVIGKRLENTEIYNREWGISTLNAIMSAIILTVLLFLYLKRRRH
jgi:hypothetical protein